MTNPEQRAEAFSKPRDQRDPDRVRDVARELLSNVSFASSLFSPPLAMLSTRVRSDVTVWRADIEANEQFFTNAMVRRMRFTNNPLAPLLRALARISDYTLLTDIQKVSSEGGANRVQLMESLQPPRKVISYRTRPEEWPTNAEGKQRSPLEVFLDPARQDYVLLSPYQVQAVGIMEMVHSAGKVLGDFDGESLQRDFEILILAYAGVKVDLKDGTQETLRVDSRFLEGDFYHVATAPSPYESIFASLPERIQEAELLGSPLGSGSGTQQHLAITVLASWLRMSWLGVRISQIERLTHWRDFFDGFMYGTRREWIGEAWILPNNMQKDLRNRIVLQGPLAFEEDLPWLVTPGPVPLVFLGIAARLIREATDRCGVLDLVPHGFYLPDGDTSDEELDELARLPEIAVEAEEVMPLGGDRILLQLRRIYADLVSSPQACMARLTF